MADVSFPGTPQDRTAVPVAGPAFGPASVGRVEPPSLAQVVLRARARLAERERLGAKLLFIAGCLIAIPFMIDLLGFTGVITAQSRLSTSPLMRDMLAGWSVTLVDGAAVLLEALLILACWVGAGRFGAGRPKGALLLAVFGAAGSILWVPVLWGAAVEVFPQDALGAISGSVFPGLGSVGCILIVAGGLVARLRPVRAYDR